MMSRLLRLHHRSCMLALRMKNRLLCKMAKDSAGHMLARSYPVWMLLDGYWEEVFKCRCIWEGIWAYYNFRMLAIPVDMNGQVSNAVPF